MKIMGDQVKNGNFQAHSPEHPLPEEIRKMGRDDTVCKFCGVSYLIHNEIKRLEDQLRDTMDELLRLRGCDKREEMLKMQLQELDTIRINLETTLASKETMLAHVSSAKEQLESENKSKNSSLQETEVKLQQQVRHTEELNHKLSQLHEQLPALSRELKQQKANFISMKNSLLEDARFHKQQSEKVSKAVTKIYGQHLQKLVEEDKMRDELEKNNNALNSRAQSLEVSNASLQVSRTENQQLKQRIQGLESSLDIAESKVKSASIELETCKKQSSKQLEDLEILQLQSRENERDTMDTISRMQHEIQQKDSEKQHLQNEIKSLSRKVNDMVKLELEMTEMASSSKGETKDLKERLTQARGDLDAMRAEREMMITAHQNQIEQLRESFKRRIEEADKWPEKLEEALSVERKKHSVEMEALEEKLKQSFVMEMQIEQSKHQQMISRYQNDSRDNETSLRNQIVTMENQRQAEVGDLHKQMAENKARGVENENALRAEVDSLKTIIADLEGRLSKLDSGSERAIAELKGQTGGLQNELTETRCANELLEKQLATAKEEVAFLQETVRRECEERFELTEALSQMKEELMTLKRPLGGFVAAKPKRTGSGKENGQNVRSGTVTPSEEMAIYRKRNSLTRTPSGIEDVKDAVDATNINVGFAADRSKTPNQRGMKGNTLTESRKRIAQAVGRK